MKIIGLCGGSGSGKSTVCSLFATYGILPINTDEIYHELLSFDSACRKEISSVFDGVTRTDGTIDRAALGGVVFADEKKRKQLNAIAHKHVLNQVRDIIRREGDNYYAAIVDAPLLFESGFDEECDLVVAVIASREERIRRITVRDLISPELAEKRISTQISDAELTAKADIIITNNGDMASLSNEVLLAVLNIKNKLK